MRHSDLPHSSPSSCECRMYPSAYPSAPLPQTRTRPRPWHWGSLSSTNPVALVLDLSTQKQNISYTEIRNQRQTGPLARNYSVYDRSNIPQLLSRMPRRWHPNERISVQEEKHPNDGIFGSFAGCSSPEAGFLKTWRSRK